MINSSPFWQRCDSHVFDVDEFMLLLFILFCLEFKKGQKPANGKLWLSMIDDDDKK